MSDIHFEKATLADYPSIQNMWRFYIYDMGRYCGFNTGWECPADLSFVPDDLTHYFVDPTRKAFLVKVDGALAAFVLMHKAATTPDVDWNMGEFFVLAKFQGKGIAEQIADQIFKKFPGIWEVAVIPENTRALAFWRKVISNFTSGQYSEEIKDVDYDKDQSKRYILRFDTNTQLHSNETPSIRKATKTDITKMVTLSEQKRIAYEKAQPQFWRHAENANENQKKWFEFLMSKDISIFLVAETKDGMVGFIRGQLENAPEVYDPGGATLMIDDFCVEHADLWSTVGKQLLENLKGDAKQKGASQVVVVSGHHDDPKRQFLKSQGLEITSEWYVGEME